MPDATSPDRKAALTSHLIAARDILVAPHRLDASDNPVRMGVWHKTQAGLFADRGAPRQSAQ